ncbi:hypothetical protein [Azospirillum sp. TSO22-1]|uniref:hypothetical protein n=1 Tax=Azospirillum sp. TSO22-1 TaxID=716789 RepID=UPI000D606628|nr:hypothetical protein [Azospirillum sp. TSO22-1]PWC53608.1 hypothetical protein TSO221_10285 [Azospirillum sp. TSO22-1]
MTAEIRDLGAAHFRALSRRLLQRQPSAHRQLLGLSADLDTLALRGADPSELDALSRWAEQIASRIEREARR